jgi:pyruvate ferredoxin oxidoreductase alpha subunit
MCEALYNASGLGLPIVMTLANRAIGAPINIWNDHSDSMSQRDSGWIQLYAETNQEALDLHIQAYRLAEELSLPVMVCMDGFILTHAYEQVDVPAQEQVDGFLPPYEPRQVLDPSDPVTIGAMVGPEAFFEVRYLMHAKQMQALDRVPQIAADFKEAFGRDSGGLLRAYRADDAETVIVALGSVLGTIEDVVDELRDHGVKIGVVGIKCFRPYPLDEIREALGHARRVVVIEKAFAVGVGGIVGQNVRLALSGLETAVYDVVAGLGGRPITKRSLHGLLGDAVNDKLQRQTFLDVNWELVERELRRLQEDRRSGPHAENMLLDIGIVAARSHYRDDIRVVGQGGDGGTVDIGFACLSGMFERGDEVLYICYDNEAYMNTGVQRSGATPPAARTATTKPVGPEPGNVFGQGKNVPLIARAHEIPTSTAGRDVLWWPPGKIAARHLAPYLAGRVGDDGEPPPLADVESALADDPAAAETDRQDAVELALTMADADAGADDYEGALRSLDVVQRLNITVPPAYADKRSEWQRLALRDDRV